MHEVLRNDLSTIIILFLLALDVGQEHKVRSGFVATEEVRKQVTGLITAGMERVEESPDMLAKGCDVRLDPAHVGVQVGELGPDLTSRSIGVNAGLLDDDLEQKRPRGETINAAG